MWRTPAVLVLLVPTAAALGADPPRAGRYACEAARTAGIQGEGRYAGRIELPAAEQQFTAEIQRLASGRPGCRGARPGTPERRASHEAWWQCGAALEVTLSRGKYAQPLRSDDGYIFHDRLSGWLHLAEDLRYVFAYTDFAGNYFVEEGRCASE
ncbi:MAG: hypothetical protein MUE39_05530 [Gammaproteobacteria bacterium]|jgi:hypothetical protein|nr:hypothetical protein [Gammaproteobacteria bacterium]